MIYQHCAVVLCQSPSHDQLLQPHGLQPTRFLSPWNSPGKNTEMGCHSLLQRVFLTQGLNPGLLHYRRILYQLSYHRSPFTLTHPDKLLSTLQNTVDCFAYPASPADCFLGLWFVCVKFPFSPLFSASPSGQTGSRKTTAMNLYTSPWCSNKGSLGLPSGYTMDFGECV